MRIAPPHRAGWAVAGTSAGLLGAWLILGGLGSGGVHSLGEFIDRTYGNVVFGLLFPVAGALVLGRVPGNRLGWLYCLCGLACSLTLSSYAYAERGLVEQPGTLPGALAAGWLSSWIWVCGFSPLMTFGLLLFPDGRLPGRRWWPVAALAAATVSGGVAVLALGPGPLENFPNFDNPLGLPLPRSWFAGIGQGTWLAMLLLAVLGSFAGQVVRYRHGSSAERDQLRWFVVAAGLLVLSLAIPSLVIPQYSTADSPLALATHLLSLVAVPLLPVSAGVAVLRARLDDASVGLRRSLVYGWLFAAGLAVYVTVVLVLDIVLRGRAQPVAALVAAGAVAVLFQPLRLRLQRSTERMLYGDRADPYAVLAGLGRRLEATGSAEAVLPATAEAIAVALRLPYVAIELPGDAADRPTAAYGHRPSGEAPAVFPLLHGGQSVGRLVVARRGAREVLTAAERRLLEDVARQVSIGAHAVLLDRALRRSHDRLLLARKEERRRLRRELHDGLGPALAGVALGVDAARNVMRSNPQAADDLLRDLKDETLGCVGEVRRIVEDLRPPALDKWGLLPALTAFAERLSTRDHDLTITVESSRPVPELPDPVEVATYRIATEAMTNVARHARAHHCILRLDVDRDITVEVSDDGIGVDNGTAPGVGIPSMAQRAAELGGSCVVTAGERGGTRVLAQFPMVAP